MHQPYYLIQQRISTGQHVAVRTDSNKAAHKERSLCVMNTCHIKDERHDKTHSPEQNLTMQLS